MALSLLNRPDVERCGAAVARLTARLAQYHDVVARARRLHADAALDADDSDKAAATRAAKAKASLTAAIGDVADTAAMLAAARERLARAEAAAKAARIADAWRRAEALCAKRDALAKRVETAAQDMFATFAELQAADAELPSTVPVKLSRHGINHGPAGHFGRTALGGMLAACIDRLRERTAGAGNATPAFAARVSQGSAAILALRERTAGAADAAGAAGADDAA